jgi:haloalkane dehalogenase
MIRATFPYQKKRQLVLGQEMAYVEVGSGDPVVLLHGNPASSYIWRNVIPHLESLGRCIAPDLLGMGDSAKLPTSGPTSYTFVEHRRYLDALLDALDVRERVTLVIHDWGSALGFDWANRHRDAVKGIAYMEAIVKPRDWSEMGEPIRSIFQALRSPAGEEMVLQQNMFIERNVPSAVMRKLTEEEMDNYRRPFVEPGEGRRPMLTWPRQIPFHGEPNEVTEIVVAYGEWLAHSDVPKLYIEGEPGSMLPGDRAFCHTWPAQSEVKVRGIHSIQEDSPDEIGTALAEWMKTLP